MKILYITAYYPPEIAASLYLFDNIIDHLVKDNNHVTVITPTPCRGISKTVRQKYKYNKLEILHGGKLKIIRFPLPSERKNHLSRFLRYILGNIKHYFLGIKNIDADILLFTSTPPTQGIVASLIRKKLKIPSIYIVQDIFPASLKNVGLSNRNSLWYRIADKISQYSYRNTDKIICISEDFKKSLIECGVSESKITVIRNWVEQDKVFYIAREKNDLFDKYGICRNKFILSYSGNIGLTQNMELLLSAAKELEVIDNILFVVIGDGVQKDELLKKISELKLRNIIHLPFQDYSKIAEVFSLSDVGLVISKRNIGENSVPSKTWSIMASGRPVLASFDQSSELTEIIKENKLGLSVEPENCDMFIESILFLYNNKSIARELGDNARRYIIENVSREIGVERYNVIINEVYQKMKTSRSK